MRRFRCAALAAVTVFGFASVASAADMPVKAPPMVTAPVPFSWTGFYVGGHFGYLWGRTTVVDNGVVTESNAPTNGVIGGALGGYNWQNGALVLGLEGDFGWTNAHGNGAVPQSTEVRQYDFNWTGHARGRAGYASGPWLAFVAGGLALAEFNMTMQQNGLVMTCRGGPYAGWSIGGGVDYSFNDRISVRLEYLYDDFGRKDYVIAANDIYQDRLTGNTVRGAINIKLWPN
jgi:opacity protein-like surface antigen